MSETLKNCPFCGEEAYVIIDRGGMLIFTILSFTSDV